MTLHDLITAVYRQPQRYALAGTDRQVLLSKPTQWAVAEIIADLQSELPGAARCIDMIREDVRLRSVQQDGADIETPWSKLDFAERARLQRSLTDFEARLNLARSKLCLRDDPKRRELTDEDIRFLLENDEGFVQRIEVLCGTDEEDPTGATDDPLASR